MYTARVTISTTTTMKKLLRAFKLSLYVRWDIGKVILALVFLLSEIMERETDVLFVGFDIEEKSDSSEFLLPVDILFVYLPQSVVLNVLRYEQGISCHRNIVLIYIINDQCHFRNDICNFPTEVFSVLGSKDYCNVVRPKQFRRNLKFSCTCTRYR
jgi:hypothetical protein